MAGRAKSFSDFWKEPYTLPSLSCPNCSEPVVVQYQENATKEIYYVRVKCSLCSYAGLGYISYEETLSMGFPALISHVVKDLVSVDLIEQTERELELELEHDLPF